MSNNFIIKLWYKIFNKGKYRDLKNESINNELVSLYGKYDKNFAVGKYFHQMNYNIDEIRRSSNLILDK